MKRPLLLAAALAVSVLPFASAEPVRSYEPVKMLPSERVAPPIGYTSLVQGLIGNHVLGNLKKGQNPNVQSTRLKDFVLSLRAPDFTCKADHGGMCAAKDDVYHEFAFLQAFGDHTEMTLSASEFTGLADMKPEDMAFDFSALGPAGAPVSYENEAEFCEARAYPADWESYMASVQAYQETFGFTENAQYEALWDGLRAVMTRYNVRGAPSATAEIVGHLENEMAHFPNLKKVTKAEGLEWREVILPSGQKGFVAVKPFDLLKIDEGGKVCAKQVGNSFQFTAYYYGGD